MPSSRIPITHAPIDQLRRRRDTERSFALGLAHIVRSSSKIMSGEPSRRPVDDTHTVDHPTDTAQRIGFRRALGSIESENWRGLSVEYTDRNLGLYHQVQKDNAAGFLIESSGERSM